MDIYITAYLSKNDSPLLTFELLHQGGYKIQPKSFENLEDKKKSAFARSFDLLTRFKHWIN